MAPSEKKYEKDGPLLDAPTAIDMDHLAGHVVAVVAC
jgi:hypothetical protein